MLKRASLILFAGLLLTGCDLKFKAEKPVPVQDSTYGVFVEQVQQAAARAEVLKINTEALITSHKSILVYLKANDIRVYQLTYDPDRNCFRLSYQNAK